MPWLLIILATAGLVFMERKGILSTEVFSITLVIILFGVAGYLGVSQY